MQLYQEVTLQPVLDGWFCNASIFENKSKMNEPLHELHRMFVKIRAK